MSQQKDLRLNIRVTPEQRALIEEAAAIKRTTISGFMLEQACDAAETILREQRHFELEAGDWKTFCDALDAAPREIAALKRLFARPSAFSSEPQRYKDAPGKPTLVREPATGGKKRRTSASGTQKPRKRRR